jgi:hypothetical protein
VDFLHALCHLREFFTCFVLEVFVVFDHLVDLAYQRDVGN